MSLVHRFACPLPNGMHARPASALEEQARRFTSEAALVNERNGCEASLRSVLALVAADIRPQDPLCLQVVGPDEVEAMDWLRRYVQSELARSDEAPPRLAVAAGTVALPPSLLPSTMKWWPGQPVSSGIGRGRVIELDAFSLPEELLCGSAGSHEREQILSGLEALVSELDRELLAAPPGSLSAMVVRAHRAIARDPELRRLLLERIDAEENAASAISAVQAHWSGVLQATGSRILRERALDVQDVCARLLGLVYGWQGRHEALALSEDSLVVAEALTPSQLLALDAQGRLRGVALRRAGATSHAVLLARSLRIPTLVGISLGGASLQGRLAVLDAELGLLAVHLDAPARRYYARELRRLWRRAERVSATASQPAVTRDGCPVRVDANVASAEEAEAAFAAGAEGIGLFRSEMLFSSRERPPSEDEQLEQYARTLAAAAGRTVTVRTLDAGGDKPLPYLGLSQEPNPFLGRRGVRLYPSCEALVRTQLRALLRASASGPLRLLLPMISCLEEVRWVKRLVAEERDRLARERIGFDPALQLGIMVETPSAAFALDHLAGEVDYFSIGTNDLLQFFFAADRSNPELASVAEALHPSFLRLLQRIVQEVHSHGHRVGLCGEMAGSRRNLPLLVGLGLDEVSVAPAVLGEVKGELFGLTAAGCRELLAQALACDTAAQVAERLAAFDRQSALPLLTEELVLLGSRSRTRAEAIRELVDQLFVLGRTDAPFALEQAIWEREEAASTNVGQGVAVPHCSSSQVRASTVALLRLRQPVDWGVRDDDAVRLVLLLAVRDSDKEAHLRWLSRLARRLMHDEFRRTLLDGADASVLLRQLQEALQSS